MIFDLFFLAVLIFLAALLFAAATKRLPEGAALVVSPSGKIVEQTAEPLLVDRFLGVSAGAETVLSDLLDVIDHARNDRNIRALVLELDNLDAVGLSQLQEIGSALKRFRNSGKMVIAYGDGFDQAQYYLAAHADRLYLHPMGQVWLQGFGIYRQYFKSALDKLRIDFHVFRVGTYKSALEPFFRDDMSEADREANMAWLTVLWEAYKTDIAGLRDLPEVRIDDYVNNLDVHLDAEGGDAARLAVDFGLVDALKTRDEVRDELIDLLGEDEEDDGYKRIYFDAYAERVLPKIRRPEKGLDQIGVVVAEGLIMDGEQPAGRIGGETLADLIRQAREDESIKAVVLRINSGGGSATASEIVRRELELTRSAGKPVVASMSSVAASGAYWISVGADEIWASPTTITGSIGIFAALPTFDKSLKALGVNTDGAGTTRLAGAFDLTRPLNPIVSSVLEQSIRRGYQRFIDRVSAGRDLTVQEVEKVAQGRVWAAQTAKAFGLIDHFGGLKEAVKGAADLARLDRYTVAYVEKPQTAKERLLKKLGRYIDGFVLDSHRQPVSAIIRGIGSANKVDAELDAILNLDDPAGAYALCLPCLSLPH